MSTEYQPSNFWRHLGNQVAYYPKLNHITGSCTATILFCQLRWWSEEPGHADADGWVFKPIPEIQRCTGLSRDELTTARKLLKGQKLTLETKKGCPPVPGFKICWDTFNELWMKFMDTGDSELERRRKSRYRSPASVQLDGNPQNVDMTELEGFPQIEAPQLDGNPLIEAQQELEGFPQIDLQDSQLLGNPPCIQTESGKLSIYKKDLLNISFKEEGEETGKEKPDPTDPEQWELTAGSWPLFKAAWKIDQRRFQPHFIEAVFRTLHSTDFVRLPDGRRNDVAIATHLRKLEQQATNHFGDESLAARNKLLDYWGMAKEIEKASAVTAERTPMPMESLPAPEEPALEGRELTLSRLIFQFQNTRYAPPSTRKQRLQAIASEAMREGIALEEIGFDDLIEDIEQDNAEGIVEENVSPAGAGFLPSKPQNPLMGLQSLIPSFAAPEASQESVDLSDLLAEIQAICRSRKISEFERDKLIRESYGARSLQALSDADVAHFLTSLREMPLCSNC